MTLNKRKSHAFGKNIYLVGQEPDGTLVWLEAPSWDCGWYWGFGYMETYTNNLHPERAKDITSHSHWEGFLGRQEKYDFTKGCWVLDNEYRHHIKESLKLSDCVLTEDESWEISDLMKRFYTLRETAEILHSGTGHLTSRGEHKTKNDEMLKWLNEVEIPTIMSAVIKILSPDGEENDYTYPFRTE